MACFKHFVKLKKQEDLHLRNTDTVPIIIMERSINKLYWLVKVKNVDFVLRGSKALEKKFGRDHVVRRHSASELVLLCSDFSR